MKKLLLLALLVGSTTVAAAQPAESPPPAGEDPNKDATGHRIAGEQDREHEGEPGGAHATEVEEPVDPTTHFNFFSIHFNGKDEYGGAFGDGKETDQAGVTYKEEEPMSAPFVLALLNFAILLVLIAKYGAPLARKTALERHDLIKTALDDAAKLRAQAEAKLAEYEKRIKNVDTEIAALVDGIRADADADKARILAQAEAQAQQMKRDAETRIAAEILLARATLTREITVAATKATAALVEQKLTPTDQDKLVAQFITDMGANKVPPTKEIV